MVSKKRIHYLGEGRIENPSLRITVCHHFASLAMPNSDPQDGIFYPTLTLMIDSYSIHIDRANGEVFSVKLKEMDSNGRFTTLIK